MAERKRRGGGRSARQAERQKPKSQTVPYIKRNIPVYNLLNEEGLSLIENNADTILQEIGIDFRGDPEALEILKDAGADVKEERVRFPKGMCQSLIRNTAPKEFIQHARNPERNVVLFKPSKDFKKLPHKIPMLSLANAFTEEDLINFEKKIINFLSLKEDFQINYSAEP